MHQLFPVETCVIESTFVNRHLQAYLSRHGKKEIPEANTRQITRKRSLSAPIGPGALVAHDFYEWHGCPYSFWRAAFPYLVRDAAYVRSQEG